MKHVIMVAAVAATTLFGACQNSSTPKASLKTELDTLSYEMGVASSRNFMNVLTRQYGIDSVYLDDFLKGVRDGALGADDEKKLAYFTGINIGQQISQQMIRGTERNIFGDDSVRRLSVKNAVAGFADGIKEKSAFLVNGKPLTPDTAYSRADERMKQLREQALLEKYGENKQKGEEFLAAKAKEEGVKELQDGVLYRIIEEGKGAIPTDTSRVLVHYEGKLVDGTVFDSSDKNNDGKAVRMRVSQSVPGFAAALKSMPVGSTWEVYIPADMAYGDRETSAIPPYSTLIFTITLEDLAYRK